MNCLFLRRLFTVRSSVLLGLLLLAGLPVMAQTLKPGLWEISNKMQSSSGQLEKGMAEAQNKWPAWPPSSAK